MNLKLLMSTFALVFLAELGDKTQLAALAASAGSKTPWSVFIGASLALVFSTLIAVLVGANLQKYIPEYYLKLGSATLFIIFGIILFINAFYSKPNASNQTDLMNTKSDSALVSDQHTKN